MCVLDKGRMTTAAVTLAIAIGAGHLMQFGLGTSEHVDSQQPAPRPASLRPRAPVAEASTMLFYNPLLHSGEAPEESQRVPDAPDAALHPLSFPAPSAPPIAVPAETSSLPANGVLARKDGLGTICKVEAEATAGAGAVIHVTLDACERDVPVLVQHAGLTFSGSTDAQGKLIADIPAFEPEARVSLSVAGRDPILLDVDVPAAVWYDRVALSWNGSAPLTIHALEMGADPGSAGHVSTLRPRSPERADAAEGGYIVRLGNPAIGDGAVVEVYSFPSGRMDGRPTVRLSVSAEVTNATCDRRVPVRILQSLAGSIGNAETVAIAFPGCEAVGDILVLKNLLEDLKIAQY